MEAAVKKRERDKNWTWEEKEVLKDVISPYIDIVDSKVNNTQMISKKSSAWKCISENMESSGICMPIPKLKAQWMRMKTTARTNISSFKKAVSATGGGKEPQPPDELDYAIQELLPMDFEDDDAPFDSDAHYSGALVSAAVDAGRECRDIGSSVGDAVTKKTAEKCVVSGSSTGGVGARKNSHKKSDITANDVLKARIEQIRLETENEKELFKLKKEIKLKKLELLNIRIKKENQEN